MPGDECIPIEGKCNHYFHLHCILKWTEEGSSDDCPLCRNKWAVKNI
jgi:anaphase-promoting complex subunit 11